MHYTPPKAVPDSLFETTEWVFVPYMKEKQVSGQLSETPHNNSNL